MENERKSASRVAIDLGKSVGENYGKKAIETTSMGFLYFLLFIGWICLTCLAIVTLGLFTIGIVALVGIFYQATIYSSMIMFGAGIFSLILSIPFGKFTNKCFRNFKDFIKTVKDAKI